MAHWYQRDGGNAYGATLRDARKDGLVPSVTTIEGVIAAPQLTAWKVNQALDAALTLPRIEGESLDAFRARALVDSERQAKEAAERGSAVHDALEAFFTSQALAHEWERHISAVHHAAQSLPLAPDPYSWKPESSFAHPLGFGGRCDLHAPNIVIDFKTKPRIEDGKKYAYDNHVRQLAAYAVGLGVVPQDAPLSVPFNWSGVTLANIFVGIEDAKVSVHIWKPEQAAKGWRQFRAALDLWKALNNYDGGWSANEEAA